jgi:glycosyltransferase involved in cell wall biosynthesis
LKKTLKIALLGRYFGWGGGIDLLRNYANALAAKTKNEPLTLYLLVPVENKINSKWDLLDLGKRIVQDLAKFKFKGYKEQPLYDPSMLDSFDHIDGHINIIYHTDTKSGLCRCLQEIGADVVLPVLDCLDKSFPLPWIGYIYDFQHKYYPHYFDDETCRHRDIFFTSILNSARSVLVNSRSVEQDISTFYPGNPCKVFAMPFAPSPSTCWLEETKEDLRCKYKIPENYFIISNQFWVHKSHETAFEALSILHEKTGPEVHLVCTGNTEDHRFPRYLAELQAKIAEWQVADHVHFLGHISKLDQIQIMKKSIGVIQPTLFEGGPGGGSVSDAVALGVPAIVSDIPINLEIKDKPVWFFAAGTAEDLADKMEELIRQPSVRPSSEILIERGIERAERLGDALLEAIEYVVCDVKG